MTSTDPFAVSHYDLAALPDGRKLDVDFGLRDTDGLPGFGGVWVAHLAVSTGADLSDDPTRFDEEDFRARRHQRVMSLASRRVLEMLNGERKGWGVDEGGLYYESHKLAYGRKGAVRLDADGDDTLYSDQKSGKLAVLALLDQMEDGDRVPHHLARALVAVLGMDKRVARRSDAQVAAGLRGAHAVHGWNATEALEAAVVLTGASESSLRTYQRSAGFSGHMGAAQGRAFEDLAISGGIARPFWPEDYRTGRPYETRVPAASDVWFAAGDEDGVAATVVQRIRSEGKATSAVCWDLLNLFEGYFKRRWAPSRAALAALAHALELVDGGGWAKPIPLAGIVYRREFVLAADAAAGTPTSGRSARLLGFRVKAGHPGKAVVAGWKCHPLFAPAVDVVS